MTRLVFETGETEKAALISALEPTGSSIAEWFQEQLSDTISPEAVISTHCLAEARSLHDLVDPESIAAEVFEADWSFSDDDTGFLTHDIHPYPAKFIPQIPSNLLRRLTLPGELVLDPFGGSGTTATEAVRLGRRAVSIDANPVATLSGRVKTARIGGLDRVQLDLLDAAVLSNSMRSHGQDDPGKIAKWTPPIPNIDKWFCEAVIRELATIRWLINELTESVARDIASLAFSKIIVHVSNQDSETRYVSKPKPRPQNFVYSAFLDSLTSVRKRVERFSSEIDLVEAEFITGDSRDSIDTHLAPESVASIITSPPYPNANDYHLYHRFRLFWLGYDPRSLGRVEIGSHLKHQREKSGLSSYLEDMKGVLDQGFRVLEGGRYAVLIVGDAIFHGETFDTASELNRVATNIGFKSVATVGRPLHAHRRSFSPAARRSRVEKLLVLRKPDEPIKFTLLPPKYTLWKYEKTLRDLEIRAFFKNSEASSDSGKSNDCGLQLQMQERRNLPILAFSRGYVADGGNPRPTWQSLLENGDSEEYLHSRRKEPKYVTHGIHAFKGKFYPQLAKCLLNLSGIQPGSKVLDPFAGSGTVLLESYLNGFSAIGCDMNPLAVKISRAKTEILTLPSYSTDRVLASIAESIRSHSGKVPECTDQFHPEIIEEAFRWFPEPVLFKLNWLVEQIRLFGDERLVNFLEVVLSDCIRSVSQQDPRDLRVRRRSRPLSDASVFETFLGRLEVQRQKLGKFWEVARRRPFPYIEPTIWCGDSRKYSSFQELGISARSIDAIVTSPPYATALPYIDTDRLSLMLLLGISAKPRRKLEEDLTGSRELRKTKKREVEALLFSGEATKLLPKALVCELRDIHEKNIKSDVGFRRLNMPALLFRYFSDMATNLELSKQLLCESGVAYYVVGDSRTKVAGEWRAIRTTEWLMKIGEMQGLTPRRILDITVTTENLKHVRNAITTNAILCFQA